MAEPVLGFEQFAGRLQQSFSLDETPGYNQRLGSDLAFDSLHMLELWVMLEIVAQRPIDPDIMSGLETVGDVYNVVLQFLADRDR